MSFGYWCRPCKAWWSAELDSDTADHVRRVQLRWPYAVSPVIRPGQPICPQCGLESTQDLPTEGMP